MSRNRFQHSRVVRANVIMGRGGVNGVEKPQERSGQMKAEVG